MKKLFLGLVTFALIITSCNKYADDFKALNTKIDALKVQVAAVGPLQASITDAQAKLVALAAQVAALPSSASMLTVTNGLTTVTNNVNALQLSLNSLATKVDAGNLTSKDTKDLVNQLIATTGTNQTATINRVALAQTTLADAIIAATGTTSALYTAAAANQAIMVGKVDALKLALETAITTGDNAVILDLSTKLATAVTTLETAITNSNDALKTLVEGIGTQLTNTQAALIQDLTNQLATATTTNTDAITAAKNALMGTNATSLSALKDLIDALQTAVNLANTNITAMQANVVLILANTNPVPVMFMPGPVGNGTSGTVSSTSITLTFDVEPTTLTANQITLTGATKGLLTHTAGTVTYNLAISGITVANHENVSVAITNPSGYVITNDGTAAAVRDAQVHVAPPVQFLSVTADGTSGLVTTTNLTLNFDVDPGTSFGLTNISFPTNTLTAGAVSGTGLTRNVTITSVNALVADQASVKVTLTSPSGVNITSLPTLPAAPAAPIASQNVVVNVQNTSLSFSGLVAADGASGTLTTTNLTLTFSAEPVGLLGSNLLVTGATKGSLTHTAGTTTYNLAISNITVLDGANVTVTITSPPAGYVITTISRTAAVSVGFAPVTFTAAIGSGNNMITITLANGTFAGTTATYPNYDLGLSNFAFGGTDAALFGAGLALVKKVSATVVTIQLTGPTAQFTPTAINTVAIPLATYLTYSAATTFTVAPSSALVINNFIAVTSPTFSNTAANNTLAIVLTGGTFRTVTATTPILASEFTYTGASNSAAFAGAVFTRTNSTTVTVTGLSLAAQTTTHTITVSVGAQATPATAATVTASTSTTLISPAITAVGGNVITVTLDATGTYKTATVLTASNFSFIVGIGTGTQASADADKLLLEAGTVRYMRTGAQTATIAGYAALSGTSTVRVIVNSSAILPANPGASASIGTATIGPITSSTPWTTNTGSSIYIDLTGNMFRAGSFSASDFVFVGANEATLRGANFARTNDTRITVTGVILNSATTDQVQVKASALSASGGSVAFVNP